MAESSHKVCKRSSSSDTFLSGEPTRPVGRPNVDRVYPTGLGLRPKAYTLQLVFPLGMLYPYKVLLTDA